MGISNTKTKELKTEEAKDVNISIRKLQETMELLAQQRDKYAGTADQSRNMALKADGAIDVLRQLIEGVVIEENE